MSSLNIKLLHEEVVLRQERNNEVYEKILILVHKKIIISNKKSNDYCCIYKLPNFMYGYPIYDLKKCMEYLINKLSNNGFKIQTIDISRIYISWNPKENNIIKKESNINKFNPNNFQSYPENRSSKKSNNNMNNMNNIYDITSNYSNYNFQYPQMIENNIKTISPSYTTPQIKKEKPKLNINKFVDINSYQPSNEI